MRILQTNKAWLVLADDDTMLGYYATRAKAQEHIDECAAAAALRDSMNAKEFTLSPSPSWTKRGSVKAEKQRQTMLLSGLDLDPAQSDLFSTDGEGGA